MLLGVPAVRIFDQHSDGGRSVVSAALSIQRNIQDAAAKVLQNAEGRVRITYLDVDLLKALAQRAEWYANFATQLEAFTSTVETLKTQYGSRMSHASYRFNDVQGEFFDPGLRFIIVSGEEEGVKFKRAYVWFVKEFTERTPQDFRAIGLASEDRQIIALLEGMAESYAGRFTSLTRPRDGEAADEGGAALRPGDKDRS